MSTVTIQAEPEAIAIDPARTAVVVIDSSLLSLDLAADGEAQTQHAQAHQGQRAGTSSAPRKQSPGDRFGCLSVLPAAERFCTEAYWPAFEVTGA